MTVELLFEAVNDYGRSWRWVHRRLSGVSQELDKWSNHSTKMVLEWLHRAYVTQSVGKTIGKCGQ